ncbi:MAG TPA: C25 family cysteine peptidase [Thermoanaerobaculia bacterium]|nr:C25 family cysteine peptidase [Thermoanaerobaculia bacterium]
MRLPKLILAVAVLAALPAAAQFPINESFMTNSAPGWIFGANTGSTFTPCLTSGNATCGNDPSGQGWLRLTDTGGNEAGYAYYNTAFPSNQGFAIDFEYVAWGGNGADGIGVILFDGSTTTFRIGAPGGSFGYAADYRTAAPACDFGDTLPGLSNGYLGFAFDEFGNFENPADRCKNGGPGAVPDSISMRGPGNGANSATNYAYIAGTGTLTPGIDSPGGTTRPAPTSYYRHVLIYVTPNGNGTVTYTVKWMTSLYGAFTTVLTGTTGVLTTPATLKLGFTASTGGSNNYHEVRNVKVSYPADLAVTKVHSGTPGSGGTTTYTMTVTNNGPVNVTGATLTDPLPTGVTLTATPTCTITSGTGSCTVNSGTSSPINVTVNLNNGAVATINAPVQLPVGTPQQLINTATITPPSNITDTNPNNNSATDVINIGSVSAPMTISKTASSPTVAVGNTETFVILVTNTGTASATNTQVTDTIPTGFSTTGITATSTQGFCTVVTRTVTCSLGIVPPSGTATITITATAATAGNYSNTATVTNNEGANVTSAAAAVTIGNPSNTTDLAVTKTHSPATPSPGGSVTYTMVVTNTGANIRTASGGATFVDTLPPAFGTTVTWACAFSGRGSCNGTLPTGRAANINFYLDNGATMTITATATLNAGATSPIFNTATVTVPTGWADSDPTDNSATDQISLSVPVTVARFRAETERGGVRFLWTSAIEAANAGYHLYAQTAQGLVRLNDRLIASRAPDSTVPVVYETFISGAPPGPYLLEDVDIRTGTRRHGPFLADREYGAEPAPDRIHWASVRAASAVARSGPRNVYAARAVNLLVDHDGLYRVTYEALKAAGFDLAGIPARQLALTCRDVPVPILVLGPADAMGDSPDRSFGPGMAVEFFAKAVDSLYTRTNVYTLGRNARAAARVALDATFVPGGTPPPYYLESVTVRKPLAYSFASPTGSPWYESGILAYTSSVSQTYTVPVDNLAAGAGGARFSFHLWGGTDWPDASPDHHAVVALNGTTVADDLFNGVTDHPVSGPLSSGVLAEGANTFTLTLPGDSGVDYEIVNVTDYGLTYPRRFVARSGALSFTSDGAVFAVDGLPAGNVAAYRLGGDVPRRLTQVQIQPGPGGLTARFAGTGKPDSYAIYDAGAISVPAIAAVPQLGHVKGGSADYLVIAHPSFVSGVEPLVAARESQGLRVKVVSVDDVYATFSGGVVDPQAIRDYIAYASARMGTRYVLLVGGDTYDYLDDLKTGSVSFVPTLYAPTGDLITFAPADPLLADVDGDGVPDLALGRLPVRTTGELDTVVNKILAFDGRRTGAVFAADAADAGYSFEKVSDELAAFVPVAWPVTSAHIDDLGAPAARAALIGALNAGVPFASYVGHSGFTEWSFSSLFTAADAAALTNAGSPAVVTQWGCWNTYYVEPHADTLAHKLLLAGPQGAAAVLGPTTLSDSGSEAALARLLLPLVFQRNLPLGLALTEAKKQLAATQPQAIDVLRGWTLLGDPALVVAPASGSNRLAVGGGRTDE